MFLSIDEDFSSDLLFVSSKRVSCVVFDPQNHNILASCSWDETVKIWDITAQRTLVRVHEVDEGEKKMKKKTTVAFFAAPSAIQSLACAGNKIMVGLQNGDVLHLRAAFLTAGG